MKGKIKAPLIACIHLTAQLEVACENIHFSSLFATREVSHGGMSATQRKRSPVAKSVEKWMFLQAKLEGKVVGRYLA